MHSELGAPIQELFKTVEKTHKKQQLLPDTENRQSLRTFSMISCNHRDPKHTKKSPYIETAVYRGAT